MMNMRIFQNYQVGDAITVVAADYMAKETPFTTASHIFDPNVDGYLGWLPSSEADFLALICWRICVKNRRNEDAGSTEAQPLIEHLMKSTGLTSLNSLANAFDMDRSTLQKYMNQSKSKSLGKVRWMSIDLLRRMVAKASVDQRIKHGTTMLPPAIVRQFGLLTTAETGSMIRVLDQDELYARVGLSWRVRFGERPELDLPTVSDLPWLTETAREIAASIWNDHTRFQQECLKEVAYNKGLPVWHDCQIEIHPA